MMIGGGSCCLAMFVEGEWWFMRDTGSSQEGREPVLCSTPCTARASGSNGVGMSLSLVAAGFGAA